MTVLGLNFVLVASLFVVILMLIPLFGPFLSLLPPLLVVLIQNPGLSIWLLLILFVYQFVITNVLMPRLLSQAVGLHPLLVLAAILLGIKVGGFWGAFFGIPVVGVLWAMVRFFTRNWDLEAVNPGGLWTGDERRSVERRQPGQLDVPAEPPVALDRQHKPHSENSRANPPQRPASKAQHKPPLP
jgi:hypothetical protein